MRHQDFVHPSRAQPRPDRRLITALLLTMATWALPAFADSGSLMPRSVPPAYVQECAACHTAYPPGMLPAASWKRLMASLDRHYGSDASLDAKTTQALGTWLDAQAGTYKRVHEEPPQDRITRSAWFERKHRGIDARVWKLPSVKSAAQCSACHGDADRGDFDDDRLKLPAGLDARMRRAWHDD